MNQYGRFIVVEGLEGAGKSTAISTLTTVLSEKVLLLTTREPGGTRVGETVRTLLKDVETAHALNSHTELLLLYASRLQLIQEVILPALARGVWVLADRFEWSTYAYQGGGRQIDWHFIDTLSQASVSPLKPDLILWLDVSPEVGLSRAQLRSPLDRIEQEPLSFFKRVHAAYEACFQRDQNFSIRINAMQSCAAVQADLEKTMKAWMKAYVL